MIQQSSLVEWRATSLREYTCFDCRASDMLRALQILTSKTLQYALIILQTPPYVEMLAAELLQELVAAGPVLVS